MPRRIRRWRKRLNDLYRDDRGAASTEYLLILCLVVIPIAAWMPKFVQMISFYTYRVMEMLRGPFP